MSSLEKYLFNSLPVFQWNCLFVVSGTYSLYDLNVNPISDVSFTNIVYSVGFFTSLLILMKSSLSGFSFVACAFVVMFKSVLPKPGL